MRIQYLLRSTIILGMQFAMLFGLLFLIMGLGFGYSNIFIMGITFLFLFIQYLIGPVLIKWIYRIEWLDPQTLQMRYPHIAALIAEVVSKYGIKTPRFGIIHELSPNAFTFGWTKNSAHIVITDGIISMLDDEEQKSVVGHELGHVVHSDFIVMTIASAIPIVLYTIYRTLVNFLRYSGSGSSDNEKAAAIYLSLYIIAFTSWLMYLLGFLLMLLLSRIREFWADDFSAHITENPNALSSSLVKIAYGILQTQPARASGDNGGNNRTSQSRVSMIKGLGIFDLNSARNFVYSAINPSSGDNTRNLPIDKDLVIKSAAWDLYTPWAKLFNIMSTHPLPALRIKALNDVALNDFGIEPEFDLRESRKEFEKQMGKSGWDEFLGELFIQIMPKLIFISWIIGGLVLLAMDFDFTSIPIIPIRNIWAFLSLSLVAAGIMQWAQILFKYDSHFKPKRIKELLTTIKVSPVRPVPAIVRGEVLGRGIPGLFWSEDVFIRDETGLIYVDYDYGIGLINVLFGLLRTRRLFGHPVEVIGWYRRGPSPYLQASRIKDLATGKVYHCRKKEIWVIVGGILVALGVIFFLIANMA